MKKIIVLFVLSWACVFSLTALQSSTTLQADTAKVNDNYDSLQIGNVILQPALREALMKADTINTIVQAETLKPKIFADNCRKPTNVRFTSSKA